MHFRTSPSLRVHLFLWISAMSNLSTHAFCNVSFMLPCVNRYLSVCSECVYTRDRRIFKQQFPSVPVMALTATATYKVQKDVKESLETVGCEVFKASVDRPNLQYEVSSRSVAQQMSVKESIATAVSEVLEASFDRPNLQYEVTCAQPHTSWPCSEFLNPLFEAMFV